MNTDLHEVSSQWTGAEKNPLWFKSQLGFECRSPGEWFQSLNYHKVAMLVTFPALMCRFRHQPIFSVLKSESGAS